jgi:hypothetical protein
LRPSTADEVLPQGTTANRAADLHRQLRPLFALAA